MEAVMRYQLIRELVDRARTERALLEQDRRNARAARQEAVAKREANALNLKRAS